MSRWLARASGFAAYARNPFAAVTLWPLRRMLIAGAIGVALSSAAGWRIAHDWEDKKAQAELNGLGDNRRLLLQNRLIDLEQMITSVARHFQSSVKEIDHAEFAGFIDEQNDVFGNMLGIDWAPRVFRQDRATHERAAIDQGLVGYHISTLGKDGNLVRADAQDEYFPILYSSRMTTMPSLLGTDIGSDPAQREAMTHAQDSGRLAATPPAAHLPVRTCIWI
jgi:CHASE1-domain containing sensor protein